MPDDKYSALLVLYSLYAFIIEQACIGGGYGVANLFRQERLCLRPTLKPRLQSTVRREMGYEQSWVRGKEKGPEGIGVGLNDLSRVGLREEIPVAPLVVTHDSF